MLLLLLLLIFFSPFIFFVAAFTCEVAFAFYAVAPFLRNFVAHSFIIAVSIIDAVASITDIVPDLLFYCCHSYCC